MDYEETISYIHATPKFSRELGNRLLRVLLEHLGDPHKKLKFIHLAGTNGKGSCAAMLERILREAGYRTGLFTSPYLEVFNERIRVNGEMISNTDLARTATSVRKTMETWDAFVSEFALDEAIAFCYFLEQDCDVVVLETGMGGRLDASNVIEESVVSVFTAIGMDHTQYLGNTIEEITREKCGIIKPGGRVVLYPVQKPRVAELVGEACKAAGARLFQAAMPAPVPDGISYEGTRYPLGLTGSFQPYNAATVLEAVKVLREQGFSIPEAAVWEGLEKVRWTGRFEFVRENLILDGGHNPDGIAALRESLLRLGKKVILVMAMMEDKNWRACTALLADLPERVILTQVDLPRCCPPDALGAEFRRAGVLTEETDAPMEAVNRALALADENTVVCVCGSLYLVGEVRRKLM